MRAGDHNICLFCNPRLLYRGLYSLSGRDRQVLTASDPYTFFCKSKLVSEISLDAFYLVVWHSDPLYSLDECRSKIESIVLGTRSDFY